MMQKETKTRIRGSLGGGLLLLLAALVLISNYRAQPYQRSLISYQIPDVTLRNQQDQPVALIDYLQSDKPLLLEFIFTSCTTLCPSMSIKYANLQQRLGEQSAQVQLVSISIDPETDTPAVLRDYLQRYRAKPGWDFLTGEPQAIRQVMAAFNVSPSDMITQQAAILLRPPQGDLWVRIDGQLSNAALMREYQQLLPPQ